MCVCVCVSVLGELTITNTKHQDWLRFSAMGHPWYNECLIRISQLAQGRSCKPYWMLPIFSPESYHIDVYGSARSADCSDSSIVSIWFDYHRMKVDRAVPRYIVVYCIRYGSMGISEPVSKFNPDFEFREASFLEDKLLRFIKKTSAW